MAAYFELVAVESGQAKLASNWVMGELSRRLNAEELDVSQSAVSALQLGGLIKLIQQGRLSNNSARQVFEALWHRGPHRTMFAGSFDQAREMIQIYIDLDKIIAAEGLEQLNDTSALEKIIDDVLAANIKNVAEFRAGNAKAFNALVGQAMKATQGKANPAQVNALLKTKLG